MLARPQNFKSFQEFKILNDRAEYINETTNASKRQSSFDREKYSKYSYSPSKTVYVGAIVLVIFLLIVVIGLSVGLFVYVEQNNSTLNQIQGVYGSVKAASTGPIISSARLLDQNRTLANLNTSITTTTASSVATQNRDHYLDGVLIFPGDRVLIKNEPNPQLNGIYVATNSSYERASDMAQFSQIVVGNTVYVAQGTENSGATFTLLAVSPSDNITQNSVTGYGITFTNTTSLLLGVTEQAPQTGYIATYDPNVPSTILWKAPLLGEGTITEINTGPGLIGGPITESGTISFANFAAFSLWGNNTSNTAVPDAITLNIGDIVSHTGSSLVLPAGTPGQVLVAQGAGAALQWLNLPGSGTVTSVATAAGLTGGPIIGVGTIGFDTVPAFSLWGNNTAGTATPTSVSLAIGQIVTNTGSSLLLSPGTAGQVLSCNGAGVAIGWRSVSGTGTVTEINTGTGLTGGPITASGTINFDNIGAYSIWANNTNATAPPSAINLAVGELVSRNGANNLILTPGLEGQILFSHGTGADLTWEYISVSMINPAESTGSGNFVLDTTPRLVTPRLGTVQQGNLAACIGYTTANLSGTINLATQVSGVLALGNGGTGTDLSVGTTTGGILYKSNTVLATTTAGTTGQLLRSTGGSAPTWLASGNAGQILLSAGSGSAPTWTDLTTQVVTSISGTTDQISPNQSTGNVTLSLPQNISATSSPTFANMTLTSRLNPNNNITPFISETGGVYYGNQFSNTFAFVTPAIGTDSYLNSFQPYFRCNAAGTRTNVEGARFTLNYLTSGTAQTITNAYTVHILSPSDSVTGVTVANRYALRVDDTSGNTALSVVSNGRVGVGTLAPQKKLEVKDSTGAQARFTYTANSVYADVQTDSSGVLNFTPTGGLTRFIGNLTFTITSDYVVFAGAPANYRVYTPPSGTTMLSVTVKCWGAGGGGPPSGSAAGYYGGGGGFGSATITPGANITSIYLVNGYGGPLGNSAALGAYARGGTPNSGSGVRSSGGGGASFAATWDGTTMTAIAIGGGGGGAGYAVPDITVGAGTGAGSTANYDYTSGAGQTGGGGIGGVPPAGSVLAGFNMSLTATGGGNPLTALTNLGGNGGSGLASDLGGSGGGGYGGGAGSRDVGSAFLRLGGGGGGNYGLTTTAAGLNGNLGGTAGNNTDIDYYPNAGNGGAINSVGQPGAIIMYVTLRQSIQNLLNYRVYISTNRAQTPGAGATDVSFDPYLDSEYADPTQMFYDPMKFHAPAPGTNFVVPAGGSGVYKITSLCRVYDGGSALGMYIKKNGTNQIPNGFFWGTDSGGRASTTCTWNMRLNVSDIIVLVSSRGGATGWYNMTFTMERIC